MSTVPLPERFAEWIEDDDEAGAWARPNCDVFSANQMRAYGASCAAAERERCAKLCDDVSWSSMSGWAAQCAKQIREQT